MAEPATRFATIKINDHTATFLIEKPIFDPRTGKVQGWLRKHRNPTQEEQIGLRRVEMVLRGILGLEGRCLKPQLKAVKYAQAPIDQWEFSYGCDQGDFRVGVELVDQGGAEVVKVNPHEAVVRIPRGVYRVSVQSRNGVKVDA